MCHEEPTGLWGFSRQGLLENSFFFCILVPRPGIKPVPPAVDEWSLNHWTTISNKGSLKEKPLNMSSKRPEMY